MIRFSVRLGVCICSLVLSAISVLAAEPTREDLTGTWTHTSFVLDPSSVKPTSDPRIRLSDSRIWASGDLELKQTGNALTGTLVLKPFGTKLCITGSREPSGDEPAGAPDVIKLRGKGILEARPASGGQPETPKLDLDYELYGFISPDPNGEGFSVRGVIRTIKVDPVYPKEPHVVGAFVLLPEGAKLTPFAPSP